MWRDIRPSSKDYKIGKHQASSYKLVICHAINNPMMQRFTDPAGKIQTQIPIALSLILTAVAYPAVSSTEASQTPAR